MPAWKDSTYHEIGIESLQILRIGPQHIVLLIYGHLLLFLMANGDISLKYRIDCLNQLNYK